MCCFTYRGYSLFVGAVHIIFSILGIIMSVYLIGQYTPYENHERSNTIEDSLTFVELWESNRKDIVLHEVITSTAKPMVERTKWYLFGILGSFFACVLQLVLATLLVAGILNERPKVMRAYIVVDISFFVLGIFGVIILFIVQINSDNTKDEELFETVMIIVSIGFGILLFLPVYVLYRRMCEANNQSEDIALRKSAAINPVQYGDV